MITPSNGYLDGSGISPFGSHEDHKHNTVNQSASTAANIAGIVADFNALLAKLKNAGLMVADVFSLTLSKELDDTEESHANRQYNTGKISSVEVDSENVITITLSCPVSELKDFDGLHGWGVHKWLGIGVNAGVNPITGLKYNGTSLSAEDVSEATAVGLDAGYFVRWVAADLVLAEDNTQKSVDTFTLWADGYEETTYKLKIVEG